MLAANDRSYVHDDSCFCADCLIPSCLISYVMPGEDLLEDMLKLDSLAGLC